MPNTKKNASLATASSVSTKATPKRTLADLFNAMNITTGDATEAAIVLVREHLNDPALMLQDELSEANTTVIANLFADRATTTQSTVGDSPSAPATDNGHARNLDAEVDESVLARLTYSSDEGAIHNNRLLEAAQAMRHELAAKLAAKQQMQIWVNDYLEYGVYPTDHLGDRLSADLEKEVIDTATLIRDYNLNELAGVSHPRPVPVTYRLTQRGADRPLMLKADGNYPAFPGVAPPKGMRSLPES